VGTIDSAASTRARGRSEVPGGDFIKFLAAPLGQSPAIISALLSLTHSLSLSLSVLLSLARSAELINLSPPVPVYHSACTFPAGRPAHLQASAAHEGCSRSRGILISGICALSMGSMVHGIVARRDRLVWEAARECTAINAINAHRTGAMPGTSEHVAGNRR